LKRTLKIVIPMAGWGTRMRPHTWSKPKPLVGVAGKPSFDHLMDMFQTIPVDFDIEFVFIISPYLGEQIPVYIEKHYPSIKANYIVQDEMKGQSHAIWLSRKLIEGPTIVIFSDTLLDTDFRFLSTFQYDGVAWVKPVPDPRRFGVAVLDANQYIQKLIEKPTELENNLVVVGCYYFKNGSDLVEAVDRQIEENIQLKGEFFLADAINLMLKGGSKMTTQPVEVWLDTGTIEATLETNRFLLDHGKDNSSEATQIPNVQVISPVVCSSECESLEFHRRSSSFPLVPTVSSKTQSFPIVSWMKDQKSEIPPFRAHLSAETQKSTGHQKRSILAITRS